MGRGDSLQLLRKPERCSGNRVLDASTGEEAIRFVIRRSDYCILRDNRAKFSGIHIYTIAFHLCFFYFSHLAWKQPVGCRTGYGVKIFIACETVDAGLCVCGVSPAKVHQDVSNLPMILDLYSIVVFCKLPFYFKSLLSFGIADTL